MMTIQNWKTRYKARIQAVALGISVLASFGIYAGLQMENEAIAGVCFGFLALAMGLTIWV